MVAAEELDCLHLVAIAENDGDGVRNVRQERTIMELLGLNAMIELLLSLLPSKRRTAQIRKENEEEIDLCVGL